MFLRKVFVGGKKAGQAGHSDRIWVAIGHLGGTLLQRYKRRAKQTREPGQELVEFALVLPLLLIVLIGVFDLGRVFHANITLANATRAGARYATSFGHTVTAGAVTLNTVEIRNRVQQEAQNSGITLDPTLITFNCPGACTQGGPLEVTATHDFQFLFNAFIGSGITLSHTTEMLIPW